MNWRETLSTEALTEGEARGMLAGLSLNGLLKDRRSGLEIVIVMKRKEID